MVAAAVGVAVAAIGALAVAAAEAKPPMAEYRAETQAMVDDLKDCTGAIEKNAEAFRETTQVCADEADALLYDLLPDRFDGITRIQYDNDRNLNRLLKSMHEKYGENVPVEFWSLEDKAWYGQLEEMYLGAHDHYYILPGEDDLPLEEAEQIALDAYAEAWGSDAVPADELELYPGFYRLGHSEPVYWSFYICEKDTYNVLWHVELDGKTGEPRG